MSQPTRPLIEGLAEIEDARQARGKRHPLVAILALVFVATPCGYRSYGAMAAWMGWGSWRRSASRGRRHRAQRRTTA